MDTIHRQERKRKREGERGDDSLNQGVAVKMASGWPLDIFCNYMCICLSFLLD